MLSAAADARSARDGNTRLLVFFLATCLTFLLGVWVVGRNTHRLDESNQLVGHTYQTIGALETLLSTLKDAETGQRGFTLTADSSFLEPYTNATARLWTEFDTVKALTADNATQQARLVQLRDLITAKLSWTDSVLQLQRVNRDDAIGKVRAGRGKQAMDAVRASIAVMQEEERRLMRIREAHTQSVVRQSTLVTILVGALSIGMVVLLYRFVRITERQQRRAAQTIAEQREQLQTTLTSIGDGVISTDAVGNVTYLNVVAQSLTGWTNEAAEGRPLSEVFSIVNEATRLPVENPAVRALREGRVVGLANHTILLSRDGIERPIDDSASPIRAGDGAITGCVLIFRDISDRHTAERREREASLEMSTTLESITDAFMRIDGDWIVRYVNVQAEQFNQLPRDATLGHSLWDLFPGIVGTPLEARYRECASTRQPLDFEHYYQPRDAWYSVRCYPTSDGGFSIFARDTTAIRRAEQALTVSESQTRRLLETITEAYIAVDPDWRILYVNPQAEEVLKRPGTGMIGSSLWVEFPALADSEIGDLYRRVAETGHAESITAQAVGSGRWYDTRVFGSPSGIVIFFRDVTERVRRETLLRESQLDLDFALESADLGQWSFNLQDGSSRRTRRHDEIFGHDPLEMWSYERFLSHVHPDERDAVDRAFQHAVATDGIWDIRCTIRRGDGVERQIWKTARIKRGADGRLEKMLGIVGDVTEQRQVEVERSRAEAALRDADRRKDEFLATLAHELRNPLAPIRNGLEIIRIAGTDATVVERARAMMDRQMHQMVRLVDDLLDVSRISSGKLELQRERFDLALMLDIAIETARPLIDGAGLTLSVSPLPTPITLEGDITRLAQVVSNLLSNSARYTPHGGTVHLSVTQAPGVVILSVKDNGIGIPSSMLETIFDMFTQLDRRLEKVSGGLGLGLSLVKAIVDGHGGTVEARSDGEGLGSEFLVRLPRHDSVDM
ncbi:MAG: PAS domain-containing protein [Gemmatimonadaceae bacterium]|nr:PAS domain-containing protein [Gemmatimonadaceae bacterium]